MALPIINDAMSEGVASDVVTFKLLAVLLGATLYRAKLE
tara:strand:+ start:380 stop:496 length:117 start_codon:yes stop_codon:yes gene_type:complete